MFLPLEPCGPGMKANRNYQRSRYRSSSLDRYSGGETSRWESWNLKIFSILSTPPVWRSESHLNRFPSDALLGRSSSKLVSSSWCSTWRYLFFLLKGCQGIAALQILRIYCRLFPPQLFHCVETDLTDCWSQNIEINACGLAGTAMTTLTQSATAEQSDNIQHSPLVFQPVLSHERQQFTHTH